MRAILIIITSMFYFTSSAQEIMKMREVFDFEVGDIYQYTNKAYNIDNGETIKILGKEYSNNNDTIFYTAARSKYFIITADSTHIIKDTIEMKYTNLDSSILNYLPEYHYDTLSSKYNWFIYDTIVENSEALCSKTINGFWFENFSSQEKYLYGKGLGMIEDYIASEESAGDIETNRKMVYFKKVDSSCGFRDLTAIDNCSSGNTYLQVFPNPISDNLFLKLNIDDSLPIYIKIYNMKGELILEKKIYKNSKINISEFQIGAYVLSGIYEKERFSEIIIIK